MVLVLFLLPAAAVGLAVTGATIGHCGEIHRRRREYRTYLPPAGEIIDEGLDKCPVHIECMARQYFTKVKVP